MRTLSTALILSGTMLFAACTTTSLDTPAPVTEHDKRAVNTVTTPVEQGGTTPQEDKLAKRSVYFDYDSYVVKSDYQQIIENHARHLKANPNRKVLIQGNTDERGGAEYNLALGQKRAEAVRSAMTLLGVSDTQLEAVSLGKEKPKALGSNEEAWAENRRADIVY